MKELIIPLTSVVSTQAAQSDAEESVVGKVYAIEYRPGTMATGADLTITCIGLDGATKPVLSLSNAGTSNIWIYPRDLVHAVLNAAALTGTSGGDRCAPLLQGKVRVDVAQCGATTIRYGTVIVYWEPL